MKLEYTKYGGAAYPINAMGISKAMMEKGAIAKGRACLLYTSRCV